jgi:hypothetical protein
MSVRSMEEELSGNEKWQGKLSPSAGGGHPCDPRWPAEEWTDDRETRGKTTARKRGLAMRKESPNGG